MSPEFDILVDRAEMLAAVRAFFADRSILEVDCPAIQSFPQLDRNIDAMEVFISEKEVGYLHTSPEYAMKCLLAKGIKDIYQLSHVYRKSEKGTIHLPEFMMAEWYRIAICYLKFMEEVADFLRLFLGPLQAKWVTYESIVGHLTEEALLEKVSGKKEWGREALEELYISLALQGEKELVFVYDYPPSQGALAKTYWKEGKEVAKRFECFYKGIELANGYHELNNSEELKKRFIKINQERKLQGKEAYPLDSTFLENVGKLPDCCGVSVGFDRAMMLRCNKKSLQNFAIRDC